MSERHRTRACAALLIALLSTSGCARSAMYMIRPASRPITALHVRVSRAAPRPCLLVLLPGLFDTPDAFFESGFVDDARRASGRCDLLAVDSSLAYYTDGSIVD
ncbi:MAG: hypothetical protein K8H88_21685, partial [Sandaracinaceae bacterium]|nr:hypothetical protein [Sandaracinaceae bacterium]